MRSSEVLEETCLDLVEIFIVFIFLTQCEVCFSNEVRFLDEFKPNVFCKIRIIHLRVFMVVLIS